MFRKNRHANNQYGDSFRRFARTREPDSSDSGGPGLFKIVSSKNVSKWRRDIELCRVSNGLMLGIPTENTARICEKYSWKFWKENYIKKIKLWLLVLSRDDAWTITAKLSESDMSFIDLNSCNLVKARYVTL